jgi:hypothetical protein
MEFLALLFLVVVVDPLGSVTTTSGPRHIGFLVVGC